MIKYLVLITFACLTCAAPLRADQIREITQSELRASVASGESLGLEPILSRLSRTFRATPLDVRAFASDGNSRLYYQILFKHTDAAMQMIVVDAQTGAVVPQSSELVRKFRFATKSPSPSLTDASVMSGAPLLAVDAGKI